MIWERNVIASETIRAAMRICSPWWQGTTNLREWADDAMS
jgi:hypothetical protein